jgi:hypothetical protein
MNEAFQYGATYPTYTSAEKSPEVPSLKRRILFILRICVPMGVILTDPTAGVRETKGEGCVERRIQNNIPHSLAVFV